MKGFCNLDSSHSHERLISIRSQRGLHKFQLKHRKLSPLVLLQVITMKENCLKFAQHTYEIKRDAFTFLKRVIRKAFLVTICSGVDLEEFQFSFSIDVALTPAQRSNENNLMESEITKTYSVKLMSSMVSSGSTRVGITSISKKALDSSEN